MNYKNCAKYGRKKFKSKRLRKKQVSVLKYKYERLCNEKKAYIVSMEFLPDDVSPVKLYVFGISCILQDLETMKRKNDIPLVAPIG